MINIFMFFLGYVVLSTLLPVPFNEIETTNEKMIKIRMKNVNFCDQLFPIKSERNLNWNFAFDVKKKKTLTKYLKDSVIYVEGIFNYWYMEL